MRAACTCKSALGALRNADAGRRAWSSRHPWVIWLFGLILVLGGTATHLAAYVYAPEVFVAPLFALIIVFNAMLAPLLNREKMDFEAGLYSSLILVGCLCVGRRNTDATRLTGGSAAICAPRLGPDHWALIVYSIPHAIVLLFAAYLVARAHIIGKEHGVTSLVYRRRAPLFRVAYPLLAAGLIGYGTMLGRTMVVFPELSWLPALIVPLMLAGLGVLNAAMHAFDAIVVVPQVVGYTILICTVEGDHVRHRRLPHRHGLDLHRAGNPPLRGGGGAARGGGRGDAWNEAHRGMKVIFIPNARPASSSSRYSRMTSMSPLASSRRGHGGRDGAELGDQVGEAV